MKPILFALATCATTSLFCAADAADLHNIIRVYTGPESRMQYQLTFDRRSKGQAVACLVADEHLEKGTAAQAIANLQQLHGGNIYKYARIKETVHSSAKWTAIFVFKNVWNIISTNRYLYMRILNETTSHEGSLVRSLYCKLNSTGKPTITYEESGMAEEIFKDAGGLQQDEIGFEVDLNALKRNLDSSICSIS